jgi:hypothetical protein
MAEVSRYVLDDNAANNIVVDSVGSNTGTSVGDTTDNLSVAGPLVATALAFNGVDEYVALPDISVSEDRIFSFAALIKTTSIEEMAAVSEGYSGSSRYSSLGCDAGKAVFSSINIANGGTVTGTTVVNDGEWHMIGGSVDAITIRLYVDGFAEGTPTASPTGMIVNNSQIGRLLLEGLSLLEFDGSLADIRLFDSALSAEEFEALWREMLGITTSDDRRDTRTRSRYS